MMVTGHDKRPFRSHHGRLRLGVDWQVAVHVLGYTEGLGRCPVDGRETYLLYDSRGRGLACGACEWPPPAYSTDASRADEVIAAMEEKGYGLLRVTRPKGDPEAAFGNMDGPDPMELPGPMGNEIVQCWPQPGRTMPEAICRAALLALGLPV